MNLELLVPTILAGVSFLIVVLYFLWIFYGEIQEFKEKPMVVQVWRNQSVLIPSNTSNSMASGGSSQSSFSAVAVVGVSLSPQTQVEIESQQRQVRSAKPVRTGAQQGTTQQQQHSPTRSQGAINPGFVSSTLELDRSSP